MMQNDSGIADAVGLVRAIASGDDEGFLAVVGEMDLLEARQMIGRLAHLVIAARTVATGMPAGDWLSRVLDQIATDRA